MNFNWGRIMNIKKFLPVLFLAFLFFGCKKENIVVYKGFDYSDWLTREIAEEYKVEFNMDDNTFLISEMELSFPKDKAMLEVEKIYFTKGSFRGNPEEDGIVVLNAQEFSEDNVNWENETYKTEINIQNNSFETEYYIVSKVENLKQHKKISKKLGDYVKALDKIWENQLIKEKLPVAFENAEKISTELLLLCDSPEWTQEDSFYLNRFNKTLETYQTLFK